MVYYWEEDVTCDYWKRRLMAIDQTFPRDEIGQRSRHSRRALKELREEYDDLITALRFVFYPDLYPYDESLSDEEKDIPPLEPLEPTRPFILDVPLPPTWSVRNYDFVHQKPQLYMILGPGDDIVTRYKGTHVYSEYPGRSLYVRDRLFRV